MSGTIQNWSNLAFNQVPHSDNRIHSDEVAKAYGFTGALVPGVTVSSYLIHPAIEAWGMDWLQRGRAHVRVQSPLYDHARFQVTTEPADHRYTAELSSEDRLCAVAEVELPEEAGPAPVYQGHQLMGDDYEAPQATRHNMEVLQQSGCPAGDFVWSADREMATYLRDPAGMPRLLRTDGEGEGYANPAFLLGCANRHFCAVATMSPWIHMETRSQNYQPVPLGTALVSEMTIVDLFNKKGHEFADCVFSFFRKDNHECVFSVEQRAIYKMREV